MVMAKVVITSFKKDRVETKAFLCTEAQSCLEAEVFAVRKMRLNTPRTLTKVLNEIYDDSGELLARTTYTYRENRIIKY